MKTFLRQLLILSIVFLFSRNTIAQTSCSWQQGDYYTRSQFVWNGITSWYANYNTVYAAQSGIVEVGIPGTSGYSLRFSAGDRVNDFFIQSGTPAALNADNFDGTSSSSGQLGGEVLALMLNIDFSDAGFLSGNSSVPFGDLILQDLSQFNYGPLPELDGLTVKEVSAIANFMLGGGSSTFEFSTMTYLVASLNASFIDGTPSLFAQDHLKRGWSDGEMQTRNQVAWDNTNDWYPTYNSYYAPIFGLLYAGLPNPSSYYLMRFTGPDKITSYLVASGTSAPLNADFDDPTATTSGQFGGEVVALRLNVDFSDAGFMTGNLNSPFGGLLLNNLTTIPELNGKSVRHVLSIADTLLSGGTAAVGFSLEFVNVLAELNAAFLNGTPSQFAQDHLLRGWSNGDFLTYRINDFDIAVDPNGYFTSQNFNAVFFSTLAVLRVGLTDGTGYYIAFNGIERVREYLPPIGPAGALTSSILNPTSTPAGVFGGNMVALALNIAFADYGIFPGNLTIRFGDLQLYGLTDALASLNGFSVRQFYALSCIALGGGSTPYSYNDLSVLALELSHSFSNNKVTEWGQQHLALPCEITPANHCPVTTSSNVSTPVGTAINIQLQASDEDNDALTYSISQNPSHGTVSVSATGLATYTPAAGYSGTDQFKFKASDGTCDAEGTVNITIVVCPKLKGDWKNNPNAWPANATPMLLGTQSYTKNQLLVILNTAVGTGPKADASLILAHQLIAAKLNIANGAQPPASVTANISSADALIGGNTIPMKIKPN
jgi:hypothetical protein